MLIVDDNLYRLAKMQESLLKVATGDRRYHLDNYIKNATMIDTKAYDELVHMMKEAGKYNQTLEDELAYLEKIRSTYDELVELQMRFKKVCEEYGYDELTLTDLSLLNISYVDSRISILHGYLNNITNIDKNKKKLADLNERLVNEEKKKDFLNRKIEVFEKKLRNDFVRASLKQIVFGKLETHDIITEYSKLGYNVIRLLGDSELLNDEYEKIEAQCTEVSEKYEATKLCYNNLFNSDSKNFMNDIEKEFYSVKYKYIMLKILKLLSQDVETCSLAKSKREEFIELVNNRKICLEKLSISSPLNILNAVSMDEQMEELSGLSDSIDAIHNIRNEIGELTDRTEEMISENNNYLISLSETKEMVESKIGLNDFDITTFDDIVSEEVKSKEVVLSNQVVKVKCVSSKFKLVIAKQKAKGVIDRVYGMNFNKDVKKIQQMVKEDDIPELVIGPKEVIATKNENIQTFEEKALEDINIQEVEENVVTMAPVELTLPVEEENAEEVSSWFDNAVDDKTNSEVMVNMDIFETITPFTEPVMFSDRTESVMMPSREDATVENKEEIVLPSLDSGTITGQSAEMPEAFWSMPSVLEEDNTEEVSTELSFDEQINALLAETKEDVSLKKR